MKPSFWEGLTSKPAGGRSLSPYHLTSNTATGNPQERNSNNQGKEDLQNNGPRNDPRMARLGTIYKSKSPITKPQPQAASHNKSPQRPLQISSFLANHAVNQIAQPAPRAPFQEPIQNESSGEGDFEFMMPSAPAPQFQAPKPKGLSYELELKSLPGLNNRNLHQRNKPDLVTIQAPIVQQAPVIKPAPTPVIQPRPAEKPAFLKPAEVPVPSPPQPQAQPPPLVRTGISVTHPTTPQRAPVALAGRPPTPTLARPLSPMRANQPFSSGFQPTPAPNLGGTSPKRYGNPQVGLKPAAPLLLPPTPPPTRPAASPSPVRSPMLETLVMGDKPQQKSSGKMSPWKAAIEQRQVASGFHQSTPDALNQTFTSGSKRPEAFDLGKRARTPERVPQSRDWGSKSPVKLTQIRGQSPISQLVGSRHNVSANKGEGWKRGYSPTPLTTDSSSKPHQANKFGNKSDSREGKLSVGGWKPSSGQSATIPHSDSKPASSNVGVKEPRGSFSTSSRAAGIDIPAELMEFLGSPVPISVKDFPPLPPLEPLPKFVMNHEESMLPLIILQSPGNQVREGTLVQLATSFQGPSTHNLGVAIHPFYPIEMIMRIDHNWATEFLEKWALRMAEDMEETARQLEKVISMVVQPPYGTPIDEEEIL